MESSECTKFGGKAERCLPLEILSSSLLPDVRSRTVCRTVLTVLDDSR